MGKKENKQKIEELIKKELSTLLKKLKIEAEFSVSSKIESQSESQPGHYRVNIKTPETGLLIGRWGETLNSLQLLLGIILYKKHGNWLRVVLDVGDYRKAREESLKEMVNRIVVEIEETSQPVVLPYLTPFERRVVHLMLTDHPRVTTFSEGTGRDRRLTIRLREKDETAKK